MMKKVTISISYEEEKLSALKLYLDQKQIQVEDELTKALDILYCKNVPAGVRDYFNLRSGNSESPTLPKVRKQKPEPKLTPVTTEHKDELPQA